MKKWVVKIRFGSNDKVTDKTNAYFFLQIWVSCIQMG